jgi:hypothetical protein
LDIDASERDSKNRNGKKTAIVKSGMQGWQNMNRCDGCAKRHSMSVSGMSGAAWRKLVFRIRRGKRKQGNIR